MKSLLHSFAASSALVLTAASLALIPATRAADSATDKEPALISILQSQAPPQEKAVACKRLAVFGSKTAVPVLAPLLTDPELASWARIALESIPDPSADAALREALGRTQGRLQVGVINSLGVRGDTRALPALASHLKDSDAEIASAAAAALGRIGGSEAAKALEQALTTSPTDVVSEVAAGCVRCAEQFLANGNAAEAVRLYDLVRRSIVPKQRLLEATRGSILARGAAGLPLLIEQLRSTDKAMFSIGLRTARELKAPGVTDALATETQKASPEKQALLLSALADRGDRTVLPVVSKLAGNGPKEVRLAALGALEQMNHVSCVPALLENATDADPQVARAAKAGLARLNGKEVNPDLLSRLSQSSGKQRQVLVEIAGERRIAEAVPAVVKAAGETDAGVRRTAIASLGLIGMEQQVGDLVGLLQKTADADERAEIEKALLGITGRRRQACLPALLPLTASSESEIKAIGLHTLASVGGASALTTVKTALTDADETVRDEAVRTLATWAGNWPEDTAVAEPLLALAKTGSKPLHRVLGLRGYLEYLQGDKKLKNDEKVARVTDVLPLIKRPEEKRLAIATLSGAPTAGALEVLIPFAADAAVCEESCTAIVAVAGKDELRSAPKELKQRALQTAVEKSQVDRTRRRAEEVLKRLR